MPRKPSPNFAERVATNVSREQRQALEEYADAHGFTLATVVRIAVANFIRDELDSPITRARVAS